METESIVMEQWAPEVDDDEDVQEAWITVYVWAV